MDEKHNYGYFDDTEHSTDSIDKAEAHTLDAPTKCNTMKNDSKHKAVVRDFVFEPILLCFIQMWLL